MLYNEYVTKRKPYQEVGRLFLLERMHACLYYKPGKGKTFPCVDAARDVDELMNWQARVLVLSTADAIKNMWLSEIEPQKIMPVNTVYMSFNSAIVDETKSKLMKIKWDVLIVDECHKVKAPTTKTSKLVYQLSKKTKYVWGLSGTPRGNNDVDIFCQFHNLCVGEWGEISYTNFVNQCCDLDTKFFGGNRITVPLGINSRYRPGWERNIAMYTQRVDYEDADEMPPLNVNVVELDYTPTKEYINAEQGIISVGEYESTLAKLAAIMKAHQAVNGFLYVPDENGKRTIYNFEHNIKLDWLKSNITELPTLIVYRFEGDLQNLIKTLDDMGRSYTEIVDDFKQGKSKTLLLQCARCESFNLQMSHKVIFFTMDYSFIMYDQMLHRLWRMGQEEAVDVDILTFKDTIETKIWRTVKNKEQLSDLFMSIKGD